ncbi:MAG: SpoIIE family protein phosphatase [Phycisphaerae bacterium]|nr:SpoIIE family protein phosphatase [Phycisphaerae bacterium]
MPSDSNNPSGAPRNRAAGPRWWNTLAFRLGVIVNVTVVSVLAVSAWVDHRRDADAQIEHALTRLQEEARVLRAAWSQFREPKSFQRFVDGFCRQMTNSASPGHHIAVFDADGEVLVRAHERADSELERRMMENGANNVHTFDLSGEQFAAYSLNIDKNASLVVAVSLQPVEELLRVQGVSRAAATGVLVVVLFGVTTVSLLVWVRDPMRGLVGAVAAVSDRRFDHSIEPRGAAELRYLAQGMNQMIQALGRTEHHRASEMRRAREIQRALVGDRNLSVHGCRIRAVFLPTASVGGDFFDIVPLDDGSTVVAVIDVTGHGVPGALCTALLRSSLRHLTRETHDVGEIAQGLNRDLCDITAAGVFATAVLIRLGPGHDEVGYANAGHDPPLLNTPDGGVDTLNHAGLLLGVDADAKYESVRLQVAPRSRLLAFTDGLHEAMSPQGKQFGRNRVLELFAGTHQLSLEEQVSTTLGRVRSFCGREEFEDDVTLVGIDWSESDERNRPSVPAGTGCR